MISQPESWAHRTLEPNWEWESIGLQLQAIQTDILNWLRWAQTEAAAKGKPPPDLLPRPWDPLAGATGNQEVLLPIDELEARLNAPRE